MSANHSSAQGHVTRVSQSQPSTGSYDTCQPTTAHLHQAGQTEPLARGDVVELDAGEVGCPAPGHAPAHHQPGPPVQSHLQSHLHLTGLAIITRLLAIITRLLSIIIRLIAIIIRLIAIFIRLIAIIFRPIAIIPHLLSIIPPSYRNHPPSARNNPQSPCLTTSAVMSCQSPWCRRASSWPPPAWRVNTSGPCPKTASVLGHPWIVSSS